MRIARSRPPLPPIFASEHDTDGLNLLIAVACLIAMAVLYGVYDWLNAAPFVAL